MVLQSAIEKKWKMIDQNQSEKGFLASFYGLFLTMLWARFKKQTALQSIYAYF